MAVELLPDELWNEIEPLLPPPPPRTSKGGRPPVGNRDALRATLQRVDRQRHLVQAARAAAEPAGQAGRGAPGVRRGRQPVGAGVKGGPHTGPNPTDRSKAGCKRHVLTDAFGVPLVVRTTAANVPDQQQLVPMLEAMPPVRGRRGRPRTKPKAVFADRAY